MPENGEPQPKRTTDERIDAIAMTLELLSYDVQQNSRAIAENSRAIGDLVSAGKRTDARIDKLGQIVTGIVENHERRIAAIETGKQ